MLSSPFPLFLIQPWIVFLSALWAVMDLQCSVGSYIHRCFLFSFVFSWFFFPFPHGRGSLSCCHPSTARPYLSSPPQAWPKLLLFFWQASMFLFCAIPAPPLPVFPLSPSVPPLLLPLPPPSPSPLLSLYIRPLLVVSGFRTSGGWRPLPRWRRPPPLSLQRLSLSLLPLCTLTPSCPCGGEGGRATTGPPQGAFTTTANADDAFSPFHTSTHDTHRHIHMEDSRHTHTCSTHTTAHCRQHLTGSQPNTWFIYRELKPT